MDLYMDRNLVLALGHEVLMDESIPIRIVKQLQSSGEIPFVDFKVLTVGGIELIEALEGYDTAILIDSIKTPGGNPGDVYIYAPANFMESFNLSSNHDLSFHQALELGKILGFSMPGSIHVMAVEIAENRTLKEDLSPVLRDRYSELYQRCKLDLQRILNVPKS
jgi:hydrogenase maturation protease